MVGDLLRRFVAPLGILERDPSDDLVQSAPFNSEGSSRANGQEGDGATV